VKANRGLTVERMVKLGRVSRSSFYRFDQDRLARRDGDMELRDAIHRIALEWLSYGRPRITEELRRQGWTVNPKRVRRLLREDNLLCMFIGQNDLVGHLVTRPATPSKLADFGRLNGVTGKYLGSFLLTTPVPQVASTAYILLVPGHSLQPGVERVGSVIPSLTCVPDNFPHRALVLLCVIQRCPGCPG
jgi:hypothetical protein